MIRLFKGDSENESPGTMRSTRAETSAIARGTDKSGKDQSTCANDGTPWKVRTCKLRLIPVENFGTKRIDGALQPPWRRPETVLDKHDSLSAYLKFSMVPEGRRAHLFLSKCDVLFLNNMVGIMSAVGAMNETRYPTEGEKIWNDGIWYYDLPLPLLLISH